MQGGVQLDCHRKRQKLRFLGLEGARRLLCRGRW